MSPQAPWCAPRSTNQGGPAGAGRAARTLARLTARALDRLEARHARAVHTHQARNRSSPTHRGNQ